MPTFPASGIQPGDDLSGEAPELLGPDILDTVLNVEPLVPKVHEGQVHTNLT